jgi:hypothetical protein
MRTLNLWILLMVLLSAVVACASTTPNWLSATELPDYPQSRYLTGTGSGQSYEEATSQAQAEIGAQIQVSVKSEFIRTIEEVTTDEQVNYLDMSEKTTSSLVEEQLRAVEVVRRAESNGTFHVFAVISKQSLIASLKTELDILWEEIHQQVAAGRLAVAGGNIFEAMENYFAAEQQFGPFYTKRALYDAFVTPAYDNAELLSLGKLDAEMRELLHGLHLEIVSGDEQTVALGDELGSAIVFRAHFQPAGQQKQIPLDRFPLLVTQVASGEKKHLVTGSDGSVKVYLTAGGGSGRQRVLCRPQLARLPEVFHTTLRATEAIAHYRIEAEQGPQFAIRVTDDTGHRLTEVEENLARTVSKYGYTVSADAALLLRGEVSNFEVREVEQMSGSLYVATVELAVELVRIADGDLLASASGTGKGSGTTAAKAQAKAIEKAKLKKSVLQDLLSQGAGR